MSADGTLVRDALQEYFVSNDLPAGGGYEDAWVELPVGPLTLRFPNTAGRRAVVPRHDLHHVATGYGTHLAGEGEIGAWELASGCWHARTAWVLNMLAVWPVLFYAPGPLLRAFVRGRHSRNLYDETPLEPLLERSVAELRERLLADDPQPEPTGADRLAFAGFVARVVGLQLAIAAVLLGLPLWLWLGA